MSNPLEKLLEATQEKLEEWTDHPMARLWIQEMIRLCIPDKVHLCTGSDEEFAQLSQEMVDSGMFIRLNEEIRANSYLCCSDPADVARVEERTYICSQLEENAGPTNNWAPPAEMKRKLRQLFHGAMRGRTLYVIPYSMGPIDSDISHIGIQVTDSPYVVCSMKTMTRMGTMAVKKLGERGTFIPCIHSVGWPLDEKKELPWPCDPENTYIAHFPEMRTVWSFGSGYGGNALLGKKCFALRIASVMARDSDWLAEHMLILGITNPEGIKKYIAAAFPSACGKTNLAMLQPSLPGWKIECVGDDIAWMKFDDEGDLYAINPEAGFFGVAPGTSEESNPNAMAAMRANTIFTNVALTKDGDVWWEGKTKERPEGLTDWLKQPVNKDHKGPVAHPNARFTAPASQCPVIDPAWQDPKGVRISAIIFGGRRSSVVPLVFESFNWQHGTFLGTTVSSQRTAAASGEVGSLRHDPFAMLPFCGYNMGDYFAHWLSMGTLSKPNRLPKIFHVNWFRKNAEGQFLWPGFGDNILVLEWIFKRCSLEGEATETAIGYVPTPEALDTTGLNISPEVMEELLSVKPKEWLEEVKNLRQYYQLFNESLPKEITNELNALEKRLKE